MKNSKTMHLRLSDSLNTDLEEFSKIHGTSKSKLTRELIEDKIYSEDNVLQNSDVLPLDSPFYSLDFLRFIIFILTTFNEFRTNYNDVALWSIILKKNFYKLDSELQSLLMPVVIDFDRLLRETNEKPEDRHYYKFNLDRVELDYYIRRYVNLNM